MSVQSSASAYGTEIESTEESQAITLEQVYGSLASLIVTGKLTEFEQRCREVLVDLAPLLHALGSVVGSDCDESARLAYLGAAFFLAPDFSPFSAAYERARFQVCDTQLHDSRAVRTQFAGRDSKELQLLMGALHCSNGDYSFAVDCYRRALAYDAEDVDATRGLAFALQNCGKLGEACAAFRRLTALAPLCCEAFSNLANASFAAGRFDDGAKAAASALTLDPLSRTANSNRLFHLNADEHTSDAELANAHVEWGRAVMTQIDDPMRPFDNAPAESRRLRIGYVSGDFCRHSISFFLLPILETHDRENFEIFCYDNGRNVDSVTERFQRAAHHWRTIAQESDHAVVDAVKADGIDLLVDLAGHTARNRLRVFARRAAPVQLTYLGYPNSTGLRTMDYRITDAYADPPGQTEQLHTEQLVRPFSSFLCYSPPTDAPAVVLPPSLKLGAPTFGCFNDRTKVHDGTLEIWSEILGRCPGSRLFLKMRALADVECQTYLLDFLSRRGVDQERIILAPRDPILRRHLFTYGRVDVALDTFPYNGTTTTCEALWMGVPVVTLVGASHRSRVGFSVLRNLGLDCCVAHTPDEYVRRASELAASREVLTGLRRTLRQRMRQSAIMRAGEFVPRLEAGYRELWHRWCARHRRETSAHAVE